MVLLIFAGLGAAAVYMMRRRNHDNAEQATEAQKTFGNPVFEINSNPLRAGACDDGNKKKFDGVVGIDGKTYEI